VNIIWARSFEKYEDIRFLHIVDIALALRMRAKEKQHLNFYHAHTNYNLLEVEGHGRE